MNKEKQTYLSPETETLVIRFEGMVCTSPTGEKFGDQNNWGGMGGWTDDE